MKISLIKAHISKLAQTEEKCPASGLHVDLARKEQTSKLNGLSKERGLRGMLGRKNNDASETLSPFASAIIDGSLESLERRDLTRMSVLYTKIVNEVVFDQIDGAWVKGELVRLRQRIRDQSVLWKRNSRRTGHLVSSR